MLTSETKRRIDSCRDILVGKLPLPSDQVELITLALIYKFMDDLDEESVTMGGKRSFFVGDLAKYRWRALIPQTISAEARLTLFAQGVEAIAKAEHLPGLFRDIFRNAFLKFRDGRILTLFLGEINGFEYSHSEELGNAFEYLLQCMGIQGENGQFRTPRHIIDFIIACLDPQPHERILDPACGTGGFLVSAYKHILARYTSEPERGSSAPSPDLSAEGHSPVGSGRGMGDSHPLTDFLPGDLLTHSQRQKLYRNLTGYDITDLMVKLTKVNLFLHGFPDPAIHIYDTLSNDARWDEKADVIAANPPFMTPKGGVTPHAKFRVAAKKAEVLFTDYIAEHLTPNGRAGVIVPNGIVATTQNAYIQLRRFLVEDSLVAVVSLPAGVFKPYSGVKTSILFLDKALARKTDQVLFLKITADGFDLGDQRRPVSTNDLPEAERVVREWFSGNLDQVRATPLAWKAVAKRELLVSRDLSLSAERFLGGTVASGGTAVRVRLGDILSLEYGKPLKDSDRSGSGHPVFGSNGVVGLHREYLVAGPLIVVGRKGSAGAVTYSDGPGWPIDTTYYVAMKRDDVDLKYTYWSLLKADLARIAESAGVPGLNRIDAYQVEIPLPPLDEQRRIVAEIEGYQKVIDGARQILAAWEPHIETDPKWQSVPLGQIAEVQLGKMLDKVKHRTGQLLPYLRNVNVRWGRIDTDDLFKMHFEDDELERFELRGGDVLVCEGGEPGRAAVWDGRMPDLKYQKALHRVRFRVPYEPKMLVYWLGILAKSKVWADRFHGATIKHLTREVFIELEIPLPPLDVQRRIVAELDAESAQIETVRALIPRFEAKIQRVMDRVWGADSSTSGQLPGQPRVSKEETSECPS